MSEHSIYEAIMKVSRPIFTSKEIAYFSGRSVSSVSTALGNIAGRGSITRIIRGLWANTVDPSFNQLSVVTFLSGSRAYISFLSALHIYGIISQIPKIIYAASISHTKIFKTPVGTYSFHQLSPLFFYGFDWHKGNNYFLIASPEKALVDSLYVSSRKGNRFGNFPELNFPRSFSFKRARKWVELIPQEKIRRNVLEKLENLR